jgi:hypothetical protein
MKNIIKIGILICVMTSPIFAGLVFDAEMNDQIVLADTIGNSNNYYEFSEYTSQLWVAIDYHATTNVGGEIRVQVTAERAVGVVIDDNKNSIGDLWNYTIDLKNDNSGVADTSTITLIVQGLPDPWSSTAWKNRIAASWWTFDDGVGTELLNLSIDPLAVTSGWTTFSGDLDLGAGYEYIAYALRFSDIGNFNSSLRIDNMDIVSIPEPCLFIIYNLLFIICYRRKFIPIKISVGI